MKLSTATTTSAQAIKLLISACFHIGQTYWSNRKLSTFLEHYAFFFLFVSNLLFVLSTWPLYCILHRIKGKTEERTNQLTNERKEEEEKWKNQIIVLWQSNEKQQLQNEKHSKRLDCTVLWRGVRAWESIGTVVVVLLGYFALLMLCAYACACACAYSFV